VTRRRPLDALAYFIANIDSHIDYRAYKSAAQRISTGYDESSINWFIGRRMCKDRHMRWSRDGADSEVQVRVALRPSKHAAL
jgi:hypothetical protein